MKNLSPEDLESIAQMTGTAPALDMEALPEHPYQLFVEWFNAARDVVPEPKACTLATVDVDGTPDARTVDLYAVDEDGVSFATAAGSNKVAQLHENAHAALNFYWQPQVRAVRVRGSVYETDGPVAGVRVFTIRPHHVEFWQPAESGEPVRIEYNLSFGRWRRDIH